ncbi:MAG: glycosyltransferase family 4 protein [Planctomycetota bacterium]|jgi:glycosyltransferase involved in cell wall biosynthesis
MKIAYVVSGMTMTFVVNEIEAHEQAGWEVLPLASCKPERFQNCSEVMIKWRKRTVYRLNIFVQLWMTLRGIVTHPLRFCRICLWVATLLIHSPVEFAKAVYELTTACDFAFQCRRFGAEHIHVHFASRSLSLGLMLGMLTDLPVSCTAHAFDIFTRSANSLRPRLARCKFIAAISQFNVEYIGNTCGKSVADLCHVVHCGIDVAKFGSISRQPQPGRMVCVARLEPKKGLDLAIAACAVLRGCNIEFLFQIVGDGSERKRLEQQIRQSGLENHVVLLGPMANDQIAPLFNKACLFCMPCVKTPNGDMDGIPVAMMEAMACEVPVVSTRISGIPEIVRHNVNGLLVDEKEPDALAKAVGTLLSNPDKIRRFGCAARQQIEQNFNITKTATQLRELVQQQNHENN